MGQPQWAEAHVRRYKATNGEDGHIWNGLDGAARFEGKFPTLLLTTTGRKTQQQHTTPLIYGRDLNNYIVIASQGGRPTHPSWYLNLKKKPEVELQVVANIFQAIATDAEGAEYDRLWRLMREIYPPYDDYKLAASATREIPLVILHPVR
ncbi:MAG TPA: nitroreductase family deazaflavin-dependent oxidoreductase [Rhodospirillales bacterium]|nr:nitroreductase family deazaflavin-dependent oxidoreductase [Rhodospirillales bacterium]